MKQKTENLLCSAFMELLRKFPFSKITIQRIAMQCGVNRQTFYYHFDNIYDLMVRAFEYELINEGRIYDELSWECTIKYFLCWLKENRVIIKNILANVEASYLKKAIYPIIFRGIANRAFEKKSASTQEARRRDFAAHFLTIGITQYVLEWAENDFREPIEEIVGELSWLVEKIYHDKGEMEKQ